jgi:hypothetical protein
MVQKVRAAIAVGHPKTAEVGKITLELGAVRLMRRSLDAHIWLLS